MKCSFSKFGTSLTTAAMGLALAAGLALAQEQVDTSGRALDANPGVGTGGVNPSAPTIDYRARNDIITGNVGGGRHFRGDIDYGASGEFRGQLGSDDLFRFRADSLPSAVGQGAFAPTQSVYRPFTTPRVPTAPGAGPGDFRFDVGGYGGPVDQRLDVDRLAEQRQPTFMQPRTRFDDGRLLETRLSPLTGLSSLEDMDGADLWNRLAEDADLFRLPTRPGDEPAYDPFGDVDAMDEDELRELEDQVGWRDMQWRRGANVPTELLTQPLPRGRLAPSALLGERLRGSEVGGARGDRVDGATRRSLEQLAERLYGPMDDDAHPGADPYRDLLAAVRGHAARLPDVADEDDDRPIWERLDARDDEQWEQWWQEEQQRREQRRAQRDDGDERERDPIAELMPLDGDELDEAEARRQRVLVQIYGEEVLQEQAELDAGGDEALAVLLEDLSYNLPRLERLAGDADTRPAQLMREGEQAIGEGRYFEAEGAFRQAVRRQPDDPLAHMGLVHAQMGAGMIRSAAMRLREVFDEHPEVIAARYDAALLPAEERLRWLQGELQRMVREAADRPEDAALMLAYMGYQVDSRQLVRYGLARAEAIDPEDGLYALLRRIWVDDEAEELDVEVDVERDVEVERDRDE